VPSVLERTSAATCNPGPHPTIASSTDTHADLVEAAARAGKAIFCEKPLDLDRRRAAACAAVAEQCGMPLMVAFNRRFDPNFARLEREIRAGRIVRPEILHITSYDPAPPTIEFVRRSGGMFRDMMIHDLDMACWLLDEEPAELFATASVMVDPAIGEAGDVDTAVVTLRMKSGARCQIANSRRAVYGYDQRIEVLGSKGGISAENVVESTVVFSGAEGVVSGPVADISPRGALAGSAAVRRSASGDVWQSQFRLRQRRPKEGRSVRLSPILQAFRKYFQMCRSVRAPRSTPSWCAPARGQVFRENQLGFPGSGGIFAPGPSGEVWW
jgi:predicted dehydrogenase